MLNVVRDENYLKNVSGVEGVYVIVKPECAEDWMWVQDLEMDRRYLKEPRSWRKLMDMEAPAYLEG